MELTQHDIACLIGVLSVPGSVAKLAELRDIRAARLALKAAQLPEPPQPAAPAAGASEEEKAAFEGAAKAWAGTMRDLADATCEVELSASARSLIKDRLARFGRFFTDERSTERALALADKFGA